MARVEYGRHKRVATTADDSTSDIQPQRDWNGDSHNQTGLLGFDGSALTIASDAVVPADTCIIVTSQSGTSDNLATITNTNTQENDWLVIYAAAGHTITLKHGTGNVHTLATADKTLSATIATTLFHRGANWYEFGGGAGGGTPDDNSVTTAKLVDLNVTTAKLANNSVTGAKIALGSDAQGDIMYYNGTDYVRLAKGTAGQKLQINSGATAPEWTTSGGGGAHTTQDWTVQSSAPGDPSTDTAVMYVKDIDSNNEGLFIKMKKNGSVSEVQIG